MRYMHFACLILLALCGTLSAAPTVEQRDAKVQVLEARIGALDNREEFRAAAEERDLDHRLQLAQQLCEIRHVETEKRINVYVVGLTLVLTLLGFLGFRTVTSWIKHTIQERVNDEIGKTVTSEKLGVLIAEHSKAPIEAMLATFLKDLEEQAKAQTARYEALREEYQDGLGQLKAQKAASDISAAPSPAVSEELRKFVENLVKTKTEAAYTFDDWFYKGSREFEQRDYAAAAASFVQAAAKQPDSAAALGNAAASYVQENEPAKAEEYFKRAIEADPKYANALSNYANWLTNTGKDYDKAEAYCKRAIEANPKDAHALSVYAMFLRLVRKDYDRAEEYLKRAIEANPKDADSLGDYALLLQDVRNDLDKAEEYFKRAIEADPKHANNLGNYARLRLIKGDVQAGIDLASRAMATAYKDDLRLECQFYLYAHEPDPARRTEALREVKKLVTSGVRSKDWDLGGNVARAETDGHHNVALLRKLADVIADKVSTAELSAFDEWNKAS